MTGEKGVSWRILNFIMPEINSSRKNHDFITPKTFHDGKKVHFCDANIFLFCTSTPTHKTNSEYTQRRTPGGCTTTRPALLLQVLIFHLNKETSIFLRETGAASPPQSPLGNHTSLGFPTSRHAHTSHPFYVMFCFKLTYRVSPYLERSLLCLLDRLSGKNLANNGHSGRKCRSLAEPPEAQRRRQFFFGRVLAPRRASSREFSAIFHIN